MRETAVVMENVYTERLSHSVFLRLPLAMFWSRRLLHSNVVWCGVVECVSVMFMKSAIELSLRSDTRQVGEAFGS